MQREQLWRKWWVDANHGNDYYAWVKNCPKGSNIGIINLYATEM